MRKSAEMVKLAPSEVEELHSKLTSLQEVRLIRETFVAVASVAMAMAATAAAPATAPSSSYAFTVLCSRDTLPER